MADFSLRKLVNLIFCVHVMTLPISAFADDECTISLTSVGLVPNGGYVSLSGTTSKGVNMAGVYVCSIIPGTTPPAGVNSEVCKAMLATAQLALASGKKILMAKTGACTFGNWAPMNGNVTYFEVKR